MTNQKLAIVLTIEPQSKGVCIKKNNSEIQYHYINITSGTESARNERDR